MLKRLVAALTSTTGTKGKVLLRIVGLLGFVYLLGMNAYSVIVQKTTFGVADFAAALGALLNALGGLF
jgi:hypothetical protein